MRMRVTVALLLVLGIVPSASVLAGRPSPTITLPEGQAMVLVGEPEQRSEWVSQGEASGFFRMAPFDALREIERQRASSKLVLVAALDLNEVREFTWPAGRWIQLNLTDGSSVRPLKMFTCTPRNNMSVIWLGVQPVRATHGQLHAANPRGVKFTATPVYMVLPSTVLRNGKPYGIGMRDVASLQLIQVPPDSLHSLTAERRSP